MVRAVAIALGFFMLAGTAADATQRTAVTVKFVLNEYGKLLFDDAQGVEVQKLAAERIANRLTALVPFLEFTTKEGSEFTLTATLRKSSAAGSSLAPSEIGISFKLEGPEGSLAPFRLGGPQVRTNEEYVVFRSADKLEGISTLVEVFVLQIEMKLTEETYKGRLRPLLGKVPIAKTGGKVVTGPMPGWEIPYNYNDICLGRYSVLGIEHEVGLPPYVRRRVLDGLADSELKGQIVGSPVNPAELQQLLGAVAPGQVTVKLIWVTDYKEFVSCLTDFGK